VIYLLAAGCAVPPAAPELPAETLSCEAHEIVDGDRCVPEACGAAPWGAIEIDTETVFVDSAAAPGGDGAADTPLTTIQAGLDARSSRIAIAEGIYSESLELTGDHSGVVLVGRCPELVTVDGSAADQPSVTLAGSLGTTWSLQGLTISGSTAAGLFQSGGSLDLDTVVIADNPGLGMYVTSGWLKGADLIIERNHGAGLLLVSATASVSGCEIRDTQPDDSGGYGRGLDIESGATLELTDCLVTRSHDLGFFSHASDSTLTRVAITDTRSDDLGLTGIGIGLQEGSSMRASDLRVERCIGDGIYLSDSVAEITGATIQDIATQKDGDEGPGIEMASGSVLVLIDALVSGAHEVGVYVGGASTATITSSVVTETSPNQYGDGGFGIRITGGSVGAISSSTVSYNYALGVLIDGSEATITDSQIIDTQTEDSGWGGTGLQVEDATLYMSGSQVERNRSGGVVGFNAELVITDSQVRDTSSDESGWNGYGVAAVEGSVLQVTDSTVASSRYAGIHLQDDTVGVLENVDVVDTLTDMDGDHGYGVNVLSGSTLTAIDSRIERSSILGVSVESASATLIDCTVADTDLDGTTTHGVGVEADEGSVLEITGGEIRGNRTAGVLVATSAATLSGVEIRNTRPDEDGHYGRGISAKDRSAVTIEDCLLEENHNIGIFVIDTVATLSNVEVQQTRRTVLGTMAMGVVAQDDTTLSATDLVVSDTEGPGLYTVHRATLDCDQCTLTANALAGAVSKSGGVLELSDSTISSIVPWQGEGGVGILVSDSDSSLYPEQSLTVIDSTITNNALGAVYLKGPGDYTLIDSTLQGGTGSDTSAGAWRHGDALFATWGEEGSIDADQLVLEGNTISQSSGAGIFLDGSSATLAGNLYQDNAVDLLQQTCDITTTPAGIGAEAFGSSELCPTYDYMVEDLDFFPFFVESEVEHSFRSMAPGPGLRTHSPYLHTAARLHRRYPTPVGLHDRIVRTGRAD